MTAANTSPRNMPRMERLYRRGRAQLAGLLPAGHTPELEVCVGTLQLALTYLEGAPIPEQLATMRKIADQLSSAHAAGTNSPADPIKSDLPLVFVVSYPRSGNTAVIQALAALFGAQVLEGFPHSLNPFSKAIYPKHYPLVRLVKDHLARPDYLLDQTLIVVRDGRNAMISLAYMTYKQGRHAFTEKADLASFIRWLDQEYPFGGWARHMRDVKALLTGPNKLVIRYEDHLSGPDNFGKIAAFVDPGHGYSEEDLLDAYHTAQALPEKFKQHPINEEWGFGMQFELGSMFHEWSQHRQGSHWWLAWDLEAKRAFHETGATDFLMEYGFETDPDWWKHDN